MRSATAARLLGPFLLGTLSLLAACSARNDATDPCFPTVQGVIAYQPGIDLLVRDVAGRGEAYGDTAIAYRGTDSVITVGYDTLHLFAGFAAPGTYTVRVKRRYYRDAIVSNVAVASGPCSGPLTTIVPVSLQVAPLAPAVRAIVVLGAVFLYAPGAQSQLVARFDADASVPTNVTWRLSDTTAAHIDASGLVTAKCTTAANVRDTVTALATVDTTLQARAWFGVAQQVKCP
jgi:hypothetical protein